VPFAFHIASRLCLLNIYFATFIEHLCRADTKLQIRVPSRDLWTLMLNWCRLTLFSSIRPVFSLLFSMQSHVANSTAYPWYAFLDFPGSGLHAFLVFCILFTSFEFLSFRLPLCLCNHPSRRLIPGWPFHPVSHPVRLRQCRIYLTVTIFNLLLHKLLPFTLRSITIFFYWASSTVAAFIAPSLTVLIFKIYIWSKKLTKVYF